MTIPDQLYTAKFADYIELIKILYLTDEDFKTICDIYIENHKLTQKSQKKLSKFLSKKLKYENQAKELEEELLIYLMRRS